MNVPEILQSRLVHNNILYAGCEGQVVLLSNDRTIAPFELVKVSKNITFLENLDFTSVYNFGSDAFVDAWCTDSFDPRPEVELGFSEPVLITAMISGGRIESNSVAGSASYVTQFTLESIPPDDLSVFVPNMVEESDQPKV